MPLRIICWSQDRPETFGDFNVVTDSGLVNATAYREIAGSVPGRWFRVRNVEEADLPTFAWWLKYKVAPPAAEPVVEDEVSQTSAFFTCVERMFHAVQNWDPLGYRSVRETLRTLRVPRHMTRAGKLFDILDSLVTTMVAPTVAGLWCDQSLQYWFAGTAAFKRALDAFEKALDPVGPEFAPVKGAVLAIAKRLGSEIGGWNQDEALAWGTACYCYALGQQAVSMGQHVVGNLLVHRAADLMLLSMCLHHGIAYLTSNGPRYRAPDPGRDKVGMWNNYFYLGAGNHLQRDQGRDDWVANLNESRNWLLFTHGTNGALGTWVTAALTRLGDLAKSILGNDRLRQNARALLPVLAIGPAAVFDVEPGIATYVDEVTP